MFPYRYAYAALNGKFDREDIPDAYSFDVIASHLIFLSITPIVYMLGVFYIEKIKAKGTFQKFLS